MIFERSKYREGVLRRILSLECLGCILFMILFTLFQYFLCLQTEKINLFLAVSVDKPVKLQVYWLASNGKYSEKNSIAVKILPSVQQYNISLPALSSFSPLRIDPLEGIGTMEIRTMIFSQSFCHPYQIDFRKYLQAHPEIMGLKANILATGNGVSFTSTVRDSWFTVTPVKKINLNILAKWIAIGAGGGVLLFLLLNQILIKGNWEKGILQVEVTDFRTTEKLHWLETVENLFPGFTLINAIEADCSRKYSFLITWSKAADFSHFVKIIQRDHPNIRVRLQSIRSGEV